MATPGVQAQISDAYCKDTEISVNVIASHSTPQDAGRESGSSILPLKFCQVVRQHTTVSLYHVLIKVLFHVICSSSVLRCQSHGISTPFHSHSTLLGGVA